MVVCDQLLAATVRESLVPGAHTVRSQGLTARNAVRQQQGRDQMQTINQRVYLWLFSCQTDQRLARA